MNNLFTVLYKSILKPVSAPPGESGFSYVNAESTEYVLSATYNGTHQIHTSYFNAVPTEFELA